MRVKELIEWLQTQPKYACVETTMADVLSQKDSFYNAKNNTVYLKGFNND